MDEDDNSKKLMLDEHQVGLVVGWGGVEEALKGVSRRVDSSSYAQDPRLRVSAVPTRPPASAGQVRCGSRS